MRRAIEESNYDALVSFCADDTELRMVNKDSTPSSPTVLRGKEGISEMLRDRLARKYFGIVSRLTILAGHYMRDFLRAVGIGIVGRAHSG